MHNGFKQQKQPCHCKERQLKTDAGNGPRIFSQQHQRRKQQRRDPVIFPVNQRRTKQHDLHNRCTTDRRRGTRHKCKGQNHRNPQKRQHTGTSAADHRQYSQQHGHMHTGHRHNMAQSHHGQCILRGIVQSGPISRKEGLQKGRRFSCIESVNPFLQPHPEPDRPIRIVMSHNPGMSAKEQQDVAVAAIEQRFSIPWRQTAGFDLHFTLHQIPGTHLLQTFIRIEDAGEPSALPFQLHIHSHSRSGGPRHGSNFCLNGLLRTGYGADRSKPNGLITIAP